MTHICFYCKKEYSVKKSRDSKTKFCSRECSNKSNLGTFPKSAKEALDLWYSNNEHPMKGKKHKPETLLKMSLAKKGIKRPDIAAIRKGTHLSEETKKKLSLVHKGQVISLEQRKFLSESRKGMKFSDEHRRNISFAMKKQFAEGIRNQNGENNPSWAGGISFNPYPKDFSDELKLKIRTRDNFTCCLCGRTEKEEIAEIGHVLCVNHIDFDKNNCAEENLNTLCLRCNIKVNKERNYWTNFFKVNMVQLT
jgi:hypothetical protein